MINYWKPCENIIVKFTQEKVNFWANFLIKKNQDPGGLPIHTCYRMGTIEQQPTTHFAPNHVESKSITWFAY